MITLISILFLLLFHSSTLAHNGADCEIHACLLIRSCESAKETLTMYFRIVLDPTASGCNHGDRPLPPLATIVFDQTSPKEWRIEVVDMGGPWRMHDMPFVLSFGDNLLLGRNEIVLNGTSYTTEDEEEGKVERWSAEISSESKLLDLINWTSPVLSVGAGGVKWCKKGCAGVLRFEDDARNGFLEKLRNATAKEEVPVVTEDLPHSVPVPLSAINRNCSPSLYEDYCEKNDCDVFSSETKLVDGLLRCDRQLWLNKGKDKWLEVDGGGCGRDDQIVVYKKKRILANPSTNSTMVLQCSKGAPTCLNDYKLTFIILGVYSGIMTVVVAILYMILYRSLDTFVGPSKDTPPVHSIEYESSSFSCRVPERQKPKTEEKTAVSEDNPEKAKLVDPMRTVVDGNYENLTIAK